MNSKNKLAEMSIRPLLYTMAVPLMLSLLVQSLYNIVDSIFVARLSEIALTAASLVYSIQFLMIAVGVGTAVGLNALLSRKIGEHKIEEACQAATTGLFLMLLTSLIFSLTGIFFSDTIASKMTADPELEALCKQYLSINLVYCWGIFLQTYAQRLLQAVGDTVLSMLSLIIGAVLNIILDPIMIFGLLGCPAMGVRGAAIAPVIGQITGAIAALLFNRFRNPIIHVRLKNYHFKWQDVADIYRVGLPTIIMQAIGSIMTFVVNRILLDVSATAVAFFGIYYKLQSFVFMPCFGLNQGVMPIIGYNYGARKKKRMYSALKRGLIIGVIIMAVGTILMWTIPEQLIAMFGGTQDIMDIGVPAFRIISLCFIPAAAGIIFTTLFQAVGKGLRSLIMSFCRQLVLILPIAWVLSMVFDYTAVWYAFPIAEFFSLMLAIAFFVNLTKGDFKRLDQKIE